METNSSTKTYFLTLTIVTMAQTLALVVFSGITLYLSNDGQLSHDIELTGIFNIVVPVVTILALGGGYFIFKKMTENIASGMPLKEKLIKYQQAVLVRSALLEFGGFVGAIAAFLTGTLYFLAVPLLVTVLFLLLRPSASALAMDLNLSPQEKTLVENPDSTL